MEVLSLTQHFGMFIQVLMPDRKCLMSYQLNEVLDPLLYSLRLTLNRYLRIFNKKLGINSIFKNATSKYLDKYSVPGYRIKKQNGFQFKNMHTYQVSS